MQAKGAMEWFVPFLLATTVAVAAELGLSALVEATWATPTKRIEAPQPAMQAEPERVAIEPSHIEVVARRSAAQVEARASPSRGVDVRASRDAVRGRCRAPDRWASRSASPLSARG